MEHCYSVQGQSDKHIDFGTHEVWDMSAPTFHYPIIWFTWSFSSVARFQSGTSWNVEYCGFEEYLLVKLRKKYYQYSAIWITHLLKRSYALQTLCIRILPPLPQWNYKRMPYSVLSPALFKNLPEMIWD